MTTTSGRPSPAAPSPARLRPGDLAGLAIVGLRTRKLRATLSATCVCPAAQTAGSARPGTHRSNAKGAELAGRLGTAGGADGCC